MEISIAGTTACNIQIIQKNLLDITMDAEDGSGTMPFFFDVETGVIIISHALTPADRERNKNLMEAAFAFSSKNARGMPYLTGITLPDRLRAVTSMDCRDVLKHTARAFIAKESPDDVLPPTLL